MTTLLEYSPAIQGSPVDFASVCCLPSLAPVSASGSAAVVEAAPKRKRGRPRKMMPPDALDPERPSESAGPMGKSAEKSASKQGSKRVSRGRPSRKKNFSTATFLDDDFFDGDVYNGDNPFFDEELSTLEEFERLSRTVASGVGRTSARVKTKEKNRKHLDKPSRPPAVLPRAKKVKRRRFIDPATCERDYSADEIEFMNALNEYKMSSGRMFPTCSEILEVLRELGYEKR